MFKWEEKTVKLKHFATAATIALSAVLSGAPAMAETVEEFYSANPVTLMVSAAPGGGADLYARAFAPFLSKYIPGHPNVVVTNVPGPQAPAFLYGARLFWHNWDLLYSIIKAFAFGFIIPIISLHMGLITRGGAEGVGRNTTTSVVFMIISVLVVDAIFPPLFLN